MPLDYKRFNGPEDSVSYKTFIKQCVKSYEDLCKELTNEEGKRKDGRSLDEVGAMCFKTSVVTQAKGSAYVEIRNTKVICSVFDPREIPHQNEFSHLGQLYCEVKFASFSCPKERRQLAPDSEEKNFSVALRQALEPAVCRFMFPNYQVDVFVYIIEHGGASLAAAINAAGLALADAAIPMYDVVTAASVAVIGDKYFIDPTEEEEHIALMGSDTNNHGVITLSLLSVLEQITDFCLIGAMDEECIIKVMDILYANCEKLMQKVKKCLIKQVITVFEQKKLDDEEKAVEEMQSETKIK